MVNPKFRIEGPPYPTNLPFYQSEARSWFRNNPDASLPNQTHESSVEGVGRLYKAGAICVDVVVKFYNPGDANANELEVTFPSSNVKKLLTVIKSLRPDNFESIATEGGDPYAEDGGYAGNSVTLSWR